LAMQVEILIECLDIEGPRTVTFTPWHQECLLLLNVFPWLFFFAGRDLEGPTAVKPTPGHKILKSLRPSIFTLYMHSCTDF
jgi:hypothetical protein